jgi:ABC-type multidrug transport system fused ATPase/permease subunit
MNYLSFKKTFLKNIFIKIFVLLLILIFLSFKMLIIKLNYLNIVSFAFLTEDSNIIETKYYKEFDKIKFKFFDNIFFKQYLKEINIIFYTYHNNSMLKKKLINIHLSMSLNEKYLFPLIVSLESILLNCNKTKSFLIFHILCTSDIKQNSLLKIKSLALLGE